MITQTTAQLIEELNKARDTIREVKAKLNGLQPDPMVGDVWQSKDGLFVIFRNDRTTGYVKAHFLVNFTETSIGLDQLKENYIMVGRASNLIISSPGKKEQPSFRPFNEQDWNMFAGATAFEVGTPPHILKLDWALIVIDKTGIQLYPSADLTNGDPECWREDWDVETWPKGPWFGEAKEYGNNIASEIKNYMDLKQQDCLKRVI